MTAGRSAGRLTTWLLLLVHVLIAAALVQFMCAWSAIAALLDRLAARSTIDAFKNIPAKLFPQDVFPRLPRLADLEEAVKRWKRLWDDGLPPDLVRQFDRDVRRRPRELWSSTSTWRDILIQARQALAELGRGPQQPRFRATAPRFVPLSVTSGPGALAATSAAGLEIYGVSETEVGTEDRAAARLNGLEEFAVLPFVFMVRALLARMWDNVLFVTSAILLLVLTNVDYPFQLKQRINALLWVDIAATVGLVLFVVIRTEHDVVLSHIRSTTPGRIAWNRDFVAKLLVYGFVPLLGLFAAEFPHVGGTIAQWIDSFQQALP